MPLAEFVSKQLYVTGIVAEHAEEAAFLWTLRDASVTAPQFRLRDLAGLDGRVEAHIDGLRVAGELGWNICCKEGNLDTAGDVFAAGLLAFESGLDSRINAVLSCAAKGLPLTRAVVSAIGWLPAAGCASHLAKLGRHPNMQWAAIASAAAHRRRPENLGTVLESGDSAAQARACYAVGELGALDLLPLLPPLLNHADEDCRFSAVWATSLLCGDRGALDRLRPFCDSGKFVVDAIGLFVRRAEHAVAREFVGQMTSMADKRRHAILAAAALGDSSFCPWLISQMRVSSLARIAGQSFATITGADLINEKLTMETPPFSDVGPTDDPADDNVRIDVDDSLPFPDPDAVNSWWIEHRAAIPAGTKLLLGEHLSDEWLMQVLRSGAQPQRDAAALELAIAHPGSVLFNTRAPGFRQQSILRQGSI